MSEGRAAGRIRSYPCERCGADLTYTPDADELACSYCGFCVPLETGEGERFPERDLEGALERIARLRAEGRGPEPDALEVECPSCHATVAFRGSLTSSRCAYCASPIQRSDVHRAADRIAVDAVLPFAIDRQGARAAVSRWIRSRWLAPSDFRSRRAPDAVQSLYAPYWTFDALTSSFYRGRALRENDRGFGWERMHGSFRHAFDDVTVVADASLERRLTRALEPWPLERLRAYEPALLSGHLARTYEVGLEEGFKHARQRMEAALDGEVRKRLGGPATRIDMRRTRWEALGYRHVLLPLYLLSIRHGDAVHRVVVNGATGEVAGHFPYSRVKLALLAAAALLVLGIRWWLER